MFKALIFFLFISTSFAFRPEPLFDIPSGPGNYEASYQGYGYLTSTSSEAGLITREMKECIEAGTLDGAPELKEEKEHLVHFLKKIVGMESETQNALLLDLENLFIEKGYFYRKDYGHKRFIYSGKSETWDPLSKTLKNLAHKFLVLQESTSPEHYLKTLFALEYLRGLSCTYKNECTDLENSKNLLKRQLFYSTQELSTLGLNALDIIYKGKLKESIARIRHPSELSKSKRKIERIVSRSQKKPEGAKETILRFLDQHQRILKDFMANDPLVSLLAEKQVRTEQNLIPLCAKRVHFQCDGVKETQENIEVEGLFFLQGYRAFRHYTISKRDQTVEVTIPLLVDANLKNVSVKIEEWKSLLENFYNQLGHFRFNFKILKDENDIPKERIVHLHQCFNTTYQSNDCTLPSQPSANHYTIDMREDVLLEEVGHRMGLFDEYQAHYYFFNPQGAADSFMIAPEDFKLYDHHIEQIHLPSKLCL